MLHAFNLESAQKAAREGRVHEWVQDYLRSGTWVNLGLADGLLLAPRWWLGPFLAPLDSFTRKCGPESDMEYIVPSKDWNAHLDTMAASITHLESLPPLIAERRGEKWFIADGNHRHEALRRAGFTSCWALAWLNSETEYHRVQSVLGLKTESHHAI